ncbi:MAG: hypothetical protein JW723_13850 [Bacteroidales bacterium]|nr:hypothetical protein [Bacteroidales bacterium]
MNIDYEKLKYRRQFYLTPEPIFIDGSFNHIMIKNTYHLYYHIDLNFTSRQSQKQSLYILGDLFDPYNPSYTNEDIIDELSGSAFKELLVKSNIYTGRYVIIFIDENNIQIFNDPATSRKVFYTIRSNQVWCGSQPHILADHLKIPETKDDEKLQYFESDLFARNEFIGIYQYTIYDEIYQLAPNHYLDYNLLNRVRFWPNEPLDILPIDEVVKKSGDLVRGYMNAIYNRYRKLMLPVTAGMDSRLLLAASRDICQNIIYYINKTPSMGDDDIDLRIGKKVVESLGLKYHVLNIDEDSNEKFREIYLKNTIYPFEKRLPLIYNIYFKKYSDYINLPANFSEVGRNAWVFHRSNINGKDLVYASYAGNFKYAIEKSNEWICEVKDICNQNNVNMLDLHYWENRISTWCTHYSSNKDIAQEEVLPLNSRLLMITLLSTKRKYRDEDICFLHRKILRYLWKETLDVPINPTFQKFYLKLFKRIGIFYFYFMLKHQAKILYDQILDRSS